MSSATTASGSGSGAPTSTGSSTTGSLSSTAVSTLFSQTFSQPSQPTQTQNPDTNNVPGGSSIASSASLYLYTFLATLVLLLSVSGAIILRSLILRRRHRIMVEEAIRNGTWIPPAPGGTGPFGLGRNKVDLSKKPKMWDTFVADSEKNSLRAASPSPQTQSQYRSLTEWDWDTLRPFSAAYVPPDAPLPLVLPSAGVVGFPPRLSYYRRIMRFLRPNLESSAPYPLNQRRMEDANTDASSPIDWTGNPKKLQVAIIVAMPRPPTENTAAASTSAGAACPLDDEPEIPHVEFGVALLDVKDGSAPTSQSDKDKIRHRASASGSSSTEV